MYNIELLVGLGHWEGVDTLKIVISLLHTIPSFIPDVNEPLLQFGTGNESLGVQEGI